MEGESEIVDGGVGAGYILWHLSSESSEVLMSGLTVPAHTSCACKNTRLTLA